jgi:N-methylhydantoinase A/oxoprolinase/acetone carboxylase beta subunit
MIRVGVDVGGAFTDIVLEQSGHGGASRVTVTKVSSTPHDLSEGVVDGIVKVCGLAGVGPGARDAVFHGTTLATNMVIERAGAGMITTRGFRDILHMARHKRPHNFLAAIRRAVAVETADQAPQPFARHRARHSADWRNRHSARRGRGQAGKMMTEQACNAFVPMGRSVSRKRSGN